MVVDEFGQPTSFTNVMFKNRILVVGERIDDQSVMRITASLLALEAMNPNAEIKIYPNSSGRSAYADQAIVDVMRHLTCPVSTVAFGTVSSTSALILAAGAKGRRLAMPNARVMLQQPFGYAAGSSVEVKITATELSRTMRVVQAMMSEFTGRTLEEVEEATDRDLYLSPVEAKAFGLIDGVVRSSKYPENGTPAPFKGKNMKQLANLNNRDELTGLSHASTR